MQVESKEFGVGGLGVWGLGFGVRGTSGAYILERAAARRPPVLGVLRLGLPFPIF